ncbi:MULTISPECIES: hypothetical protein [Mesobacillus]|nr:MULTISPECIES: hypothetical protein [Mesobacillus]MDQ0413116.1 hypothetical protein [Mesobacillus stamsii]
MKKFWIFLAAIAFALGLAACSADKEVQPGNTATEKAEKPAENPKSTLFRFYMSIVNTINQADADLNAYEGAEEPTPDEKVAASTSAAAVESDLQGLEVPAELKDQKADLEAALKDLAESYNMKAEELKKDTPALDPANEKFAQAEEKIGAAFESVDMKKPSLAKEL